MNRRKHQIVKNHQCICGDPRSWVAATCSRRSYVWRIPYTDTTVTTIAMHNLRVALSRWSKLAAQEGSPTAYDFRWRTNVWPFGLLGLCY